MNNIDERIKEIFSKEQVPPASFDYMFNRTLNNLESKKNFNFFNIKTCIATVACSLILISGIVFAKDIENFIKGSIWRRGKGIQTAIENGYIAEPEEDYIYKTVSVEKEGEIIDSLEVGIKIKDFIATKNALNLHIEMKFDDKIKLYRDLESNMINAYVDYVYFGFIKFPDMYIAGEENIFEDDENHKTDEWNEDIIFYSNVITDIDEIDYTTNTILLTHEIYSDNITDARHINIIFSNISFVPSDKFPIKFGQFNLVGNWEFGIDIPEYMYNDENIYYEVVKCSDDNFEVYEANATSTGFELGVIISNIEKPEKDPEFVRRDSELVGEYYPKGVPSCNTIEEYVELYGDEKYFYMFHDWLEKYWPIDTDGYHPLKEETEGCYVKNSSGEKYDIVRYNLGNKRYSEWLEGNKYDFYATFDMTKYDATNRITVVLDYNGEMVKIELRRIN